MRDLLEQTVRYLEALSDAAMDASPSTDASFVASSSKPSASVRRPSRLPVRT
ncbi:hypothetical protein [Rhodococcus sp. WAY2]|uniref:hypothetical protein n=1 Tax=Rhodococcus sp. WAY2 TaxID=2663121 RepID=UPI001F4437E9|nr:hypothetical protein [Rhodococcus sp. WAY2]